MITKIYYLSHEYQFFKAALQTNRMFPKKNNVIVRIRKPIIARIPTNVRRSNLIPIMQGTYLNASLTFGAILLPKISIDFISKE
jgi:hypothetical protein